MAKTPKEMAALAKKPSMPTQHEGAVAASAESSARADAADIAAYCAEHGSPKMAAGLIREGATMAAVREKIGSAAKIREKAALAPKMGFDRSKIPEINAMAESYIAAGRTATQFGEALIDKLAKEQSPEIRSGATVVCDLGRRLPSADAVYAARRQQSLAPTATPKTTS